MSMMAGQTGALQRPFTGGTFPKKLDEFATLIKELTLRDTEATPEERRQMITENLRFDQFVDAVRSLFGNEIKSQDLKAIYRKISTNPDAKVDWSELFGYFQTEGEEQEMTGSEDVSVFMISKRRRIGDAAGDKKRRDIVQSIRYAPALDSYLAASQKGVVTVWNNKLRLQASIEVEDNAWLTGCDYLPAIRRVVACTERSIGIWDPRSTGKNQNMFVISPLENAPQCLAHIPSPHNTHEDLVLFGDDQGNINALTIAAKDLTMKNSKQGEKRDSQTIVIEPTRLSSPIRTRSVHDDWVLKVRYFPELRCFASCSPSPTYSFVLEEVERIFDNGEIRSVGITKGVNAFEYCARANILATGGVDKVIRVWHPHIFSRPTGKLMGHLFTIIDIACNEKDQHLISLSTARVFRVWDIHTLTSLQVFTDNEERPGEKRIYSMIFDNKHERLLTGSSVIDMWPLTRAVQDTMQVPHTHDRPIAQVYLNKELNQLVTICTESTIKVWEVESGKLVYQIPEAHKATEITTVTTDKSGYRMATGALDGSLKVWDFGAGQEIKFKPHKGGSGEDPAILGLQYTRDEKERHLVAATCTKIRLLLDSNDNFDLQLVREFSDSFTFHREIPATPTEDPFRGSPLPSIGESPVSGAPSVKVVNETVNLLKTYEISSFGGLSNNHVVTGCTNGNTVLWKLPEGVPTVMLETEKEVTSRASSSHRSQSSHSSSSSRRQVRITIDRRVNCAVLLSHSVRRVDPAYLEKMLQRRRELGSEDEGMASDDDLSKTRSKVTSRSRSRTTSFTKSELHVRQVTETEKIDETDEEAGEGQAGAAEVKAKSPATTVATKTPAPTETRTGRRASSSGRDHDKKKDGKAKAPEPVEEEEKYITDTYPPVYVTGHQDSSVHFWSLEGKHLGEVTGVTRNGIGADVTTLAHDAECNVLITGDSKGYLTMWDVAPFLEMEKKSPAQEAVQQVLCWRAHTMKVTALVYIDTIKSVVSSSSDGSARIWWGGLGKYVGFFGQHRAFNFPANEEEAAASAAISPYDITEPPLAPIKPKTEQKVKNQQRYEYPLVFDKTRWKPFRRSAYGPRPTLTLGERARTSLDDSVDKKFFNALIKPKAYNDHLESFTSGSSRHGAVFRALPVYRVKTPVRPKTPEHQHGMSAADDPYSAIFALDDPKPALKHDAKQAKGCTLPTQNRRVSFSQHARGKKGVSQSLDVAALPSRQATMYAGSKGSKRR